MHPRLVATAQGTAVIMVGCFAGVLAKYALSEASPVPPFTFVWLQIGLGGALLSLYTFVWRRERIPAGLGLKVWAYMVCLGVANFTICRVLFMLALGRLPANTHIYLVNFVGIVTMVISIFMLRERPSGYQMFGASIAIGGLWLYFDAIPRPTEMTGVMMVAIGVLALAFTNNLARKLAIVTGNGLSNLIISTVAVWIGGIPVVAYGVLTDMPPAVVSGSQWAIIVLNAVVGITIGMTVWNYILRTLRSYEAGILAGSSVIFIALFSIPILGERLELHQVAGISTMVIGLFLVQFRRGWGRRPAL